MNVIVDIEYQDYAAALAEFIRERGTLLPKACAGKGDSWPPAWCATRRPGP